MLSKSQNAIFRPLVKTAWLVYCDQSGLDPHDSIAHDKWYREQLLSSVGCWTTKEIASAKDFGRVMLCFATIAGDQYLIERYSSDDERRAIYRLKQLMRKLGVDWAYVKAVIRQSSWPFDVDSWGDDPENDILRLPASLVLTIYKVLDTHYRRHKNDVLQEEESCVPF